MNRREGFETELLLDVDNKVREGRGGSSESVKDA